MGESANDSIEVVFCAIDFSETSNLALRYATKLARRHQAELVLGHVVEPLPTVAYPIGMVPTDAEIEIRQFAGERLEAVGKTVREAGSTVQTLLEQGPPGQHLVAMSEKVHADLHVIGTRGLTGFEHLMLGSTAEHVVRCSTCPVLTVHPADGPPRDPMRRVIVPTDLGPEAIDAADAFARVFARDERPSVLLVFADPTPPYLEAFQHETLERWGQRDVRKDEIAARMAPISARLESAGFEVETEILDGGAVQAVTECAGTHEADMIVMATHGRSAIANMLVGRTAQRIVQHAPCPVLTVRGKQRDADSA